MDLNYHPSYSSIRSDYLLFELPAPVLQELQKEASIHIVGNENDEATLCTSTTTYRIRKAESSNCSLLVPSPQDENNSSSPNMLNNSNTLQIYSSQSYYYELQKIPPRLEKLKELLNASPYDPETNTPDEVIGYQFEELLESIQASEKELKEGLVKEKAFLLNDRWQILSPRYEDEIFSLILLCIQCNSSGFDTIRLRDTYRALKVEMMDLPPLKIVRHLLKCYASSTRKEEADEIYNLDVNRIVQFYAVNIFRQNNFQTMEENTFMSAWNAQCPAECHPKVSQLSGLVVTTAKGSKRYLSYFPANELSQDIPTRFKQLFAKQPKWSLPEIQPYLRDVARSVTIDQLLFKHCRTSQTSNGKIFTKR